ncbi:MAG: ATP-binding protein [Rhodobacteraceae bacterium]|nr:MAG: ATP-binding protein [Paracoccaceae bacterium]
MLHETRSTADWIASASPEAVTAFLDDLTPNALAALPWIFDIWAQPHQLAPAGDWRTWVCLGGRGAGKTRAGAEWVRAQVEGARPLDTGRARRVALVAETYDQARDVMVFGDSGIMACCPPDRKPAWEATRRRLVWPNGAVAQCFSASDPEALRGPQFDAAWCDELAKWPKADQAWDMLQFALRLGDAPRQLVTTTPRAQGTLKAILRAPSTVLTHAATEANRAWLAPSFLEEIRARYRGSHLERQELDGVLVEDTEGTLWPIALLERARVDALPEMTRVVVAVDPAVSAGVKSDLCGIVVVGAVTKGPPQDWRAYVLEDASLRASSPSAWAEAALAAATRHGAERIVAEVNQGGNLVEQVLRQVDPLMPFRALHAARGKAARAEPVAALYEQGRVFHHGRLGPLEDQMMQMTAQGFRGQGSPDRVDALVWALHELILGPAARAGRPKLRTL